MDAAEVGGTHDEGQLELLRKFTDDIVLFVETLRFVVLWIFVDLWIDPVEVG